MRILQGGRVTVSGVIASRCMTRLRSILGGLTLCVTCFHPHSSPAQPWVSPEEVALAGVGIGLSEVAHGPNPASRGRGLVMAGVVREYSLSELTSSTLLISWPEVQAGVRHLAFPDYQESALEAGRSVSLKRWRLGVRVRETWVRPAGFRVRLDTELTLGALLPLSAGSVGIALSPEMLGVGGALTHGPWTLALDARSSQAGLGVGAAWQFSASNAITLLGGVATSPSTLGLGTHLRIARLSILIGFQRHLVLGWSSSLAVGWG